MKKGFVSMALVYSFLIVFLVLTASFLTSYVNKNKTKSAMVSKIKDDLNEKYQDYLINGDPVEYTYYYWTATSSNSSTGKINTNEVPDFAVTTISELNLPSPGSFIRTRELDGEVLGHEVCTHINGKIFCAMPGYWYTDTQTTLNQLKTDIEAATEIPTRECLVLDNTPTQAAVKCSIGEEAGPAIIQVHLSGTIYALDNEVIICSLDDNAKAECHVD